MLKDPLQIKKEYKDADKQINEATKRKKKRIPNERHKQRIRSLYVEPNETENSWNKPQDTTPDTAKSFIEDAVNDYSVQYDKFRENIINDHDHELGEALKKWDKRPELPKPQWP